MLNSTVTPAADLERPSTDGTDLAPSAATTTAPVEGQSIISPKKRPAPLVFPRDFGSETASNTLLSKAKLKTIQLCIHGKEIALQIFTYENMDTLKVFVISAAVTCFWAIGEVMKWMFGMLNSLRTANPNPKPAEKTA